MTTSNPGKDFTTQAILDAIYHSVSMNPGISLETVFAGLNAAREQTPEVFEEAQPEEWEAAYREARALRVRHMALS